MEQGKMFAIGFGLEIIAVRSIWFSIKAVPEKAITSAAAMSGTIWKLPQKSAEF